MDFLTDDLPHNWRVVRLASFEGRVQLPVYGGNYMRRWPTIWHYRLQLRNRKHYPERSGVF